MTNHKKKSIKFSVLIPVYNVEAYLHECLDSVLDQTYTNFEVIITNDGSTDRSSEICKEYASLDDRITVYHQENQGLLMARRNSISKSTGDYCMFLDSDDSWKPATLETIYKTIIKTEADLVIFNCDRLKGKELIAVKPKFENEDYFSKAKKNKLIEEFIRTNELNSLCLKAVKTSIIDKEKDYSYAQGLIMGEDALQSMPLLLKAQKIVYIQNRLYNYRINEDSSTNSFNPNHIIDINLVNREKIKFLNLINRLDLLNPLSKIYIITVAKQIMIASTSNLSKLEKINYLENLRTSDCYTLMAQYYEVSELILPINMLINNLNNQKFEKVIRLGKNIQLLVE